MQRKNWQDCKDKQPSCNHVRDFFFPKKYLFLTALGLSCGTQALPLGTQALQLMCLVASTQCGIIVPQPGMEPVSSALEGRFFFFQCGSFIEFVTILFLLYVLFFWPCNMWYFSSLPWDRSTPPALEGKVLTPWTTREVLES